VLVELIVAMTVRVGVGYIPGGGGPEGPAVTCPAAACLQDGHLSAETIAQSGISLLLAGTDTSGGGVTAVMEMVALFPEVMQKLRQEQQQVSVHSSAVLVSPQRCSALMARAGAS